MGAYFASTTHCHCTHVPPQNGWGSEKCAWWRTDIVSDHRTKKLTISRCKNLKHHDLTERLISLSPVTSHILYPWQDFSICPVYFYYRLCALCAFRSQVNEKKQTFQSKILIVATYTQRSRSVWWDLSVPYLSLLPSYYCRAPHLRWITAEGVYTC